MPLATIRQIIEIGETEANLDEKVLSASLKCQISSENFDSVYGYNNNRNSISVWHYDQQDRFGRQMKTCCSNCLNIVRLTVVSA